MFIPKQNKHEQTQHHFNLFISKQFQLIAVVIVTSAECRKFCLHAYLTIYLSIYKGYCQIAIEYFQEMGIWQMYRTQVTSQKMIQIQSIHIFPKSILFHPSVPFFLSPVPFLYCSSSQDAR